MDPHHAAGPLSHDGGGAAGGHPLSAAREVFRDSSYARNTSHHRAHDSAVLDELPLRPGAAVLDLGSGAGDLTAQLAERLGLPAVPADGGRDAGGSAAPGPGRGGPGVLGVDAAPALVAHARQRWGRPGLVFEVCRAQELDRLVHPASFDVAVSVAVLHWIPAVDQPAVLASVARALRPGGVLRADLGGRGQLAAVVPWLDDCSLDSGGPRAPWYFPDPDGYRSLLEQAGFLVRRVATVRQRRHFADLAAARSWLSSQVLPGYTAAMTPEQERRFLAAVEARVPRLRRDDGSFDQDYVRLDVLATKA